MCPHVFHFWKKYVDIGPQIKATIISVSSGDNEDEKEFFEKHEVPENIYSWNSQTVFYSI